MPNERRSGESRGRHGLNGTSTSTGPTWHGILLLVAGGNGSARGQHAVDEILSVSAVARSGQGRSYELLFLARFSSGQLFTH
jgi:hypothetical protein